jgi:hypothetical protein
MATSLSTVYAVSIVLGSILAFATTFAGTKVYPIQEGGATFQEAVETVKETVQDILPKQQEPPLQTNVETPPPVEPTVDLEKLKSDLSAQFEGNEIASQYIIDFLKTPVKNWQEIAPNFSELTRKFRLSLTYPNLNKCPTSVLQICQMVSQKYSNMKDLIQGKNFTELGDQTSEAAKLMEDIPQSLPAIEQ